MKTSAIRGAGVLCIAGSLGLGVAGLATAHVPEVVDDCKGIKITLKDYHDKEGKQNSVTVFLNGALQYGNYDFGSEYEGYFAFKNTAEDNYFLVTVKAWDDPNGLNGWSFTKEATAPACYPSPTPTPSESTSTPTPTPSQSTSTPTPSTSTGTPTPPVTPSLPTTPPSTPSVPPTSPSGTPTPPSTVGTPTTSPPATPERPRRVETDVPPGELAQTGNDSTALLLWAAAALALSGGALVRLASRMKSRIARRH